MVNELGFRYVVEKGGVSYDERGYLRHEWSKLLGEEYKSWYKWSDLRNATQFISEDAARSAAEKSDLDGFKVVIKTRQFDQNTMKPYDDHGAGGTWLWECKGGV